MITKDEMKATASDIIRTNPVDGQIKAAEFLIETLFKDAIDKAEKPYTGHLYRVADGVPDKLKPAALLHDLVEDVEGWNFQDLTDIGFDDYTVDAIRAVTKKAEGEPYFDAIERVGMTPHSIPLKRSDLKDNSNLFRFERLPMHWDFVRVTKYFLADKYLQDVEAGIAKSGTNFVEWMKSKPENMHEWNLVSTETSSKAALPTPSSPQ